MWYYDRLTYNDFKNTKIPSSCDHTHKVQLSY